MYPGHLHFLPKQENSVQLLSLISILLPSERSRRLHHPVSVSPFPSCWDNSRSSSPSRPWGQTLQVSELWISPQALQASRQHQEVTLSGRDKATKTGRLWWCPWKKPSGFSKSSQDKYAEGFCYHKGLMFFSIPSATSSAFRGSTHFDALPEGSLASSGIETWMGL